MVQKRTHNPSNDPKMLNHADFRWFVLHYPDVALKGAKVTKTSFVAVALAMAQYGDYATGTRVNPSKKLLHNQTGAHNDTITKVIELLKREGVLEVADLHQGSNGGKQSEVFRFRRSECVERVLAKRDALNWTTGNTTGEPGSTSGEPGNTTGEPGSTTGEDNRNALNSINVLNHSLANAPSSTPPSLSPTARSGVETGNSEIDIEELLSGVDDVEEDTEDSMVRFYQLALPEVKVEDR